MRRANVLDRALEGDRHTRRGSDWTLPMVDLALEAAQSLAAVRLSPAQRERIHARSLTILDAGRGAPHERRPRPSHLRRAAPLAIGSAVVVAVLGWALRQGRPRPAPRA